MAAYLLRRLRLVAVPRFAAARPTLVLPLARAWRANLARAALAFLAAIVVPLGRASGGGQPADRHRADQGCAAVRPSVAVAVCVMRSCRRGSRALHFAVGGAFGVVRRRSAGDRHAVRDLCDRGGLGAKQALELSAKPPEPWEELLGDVMQITKAQHEAMKRGEFTPAPAESRVPCHLPRTGPT